MQGILNGSIWALFNHATIVACYKPTLVSGMSTCLDNSFLNFKSARHKNDTTDFFKLGQEKKIPL
jgi:hypothetical protein